MSMIRKLLGGSAITAVVSLALVGTAQAEVCDTPQPWVIWVNLKVR